MGRKKKDRGTFKVKRYVIRGPGFDKRKFETVASSTDRDTAIMKLGGWASKLPGGDFHVESPSGRVIKKSYAGVFRLKREQDGFKKHQRRRRRRRK
ncbi:MAG: hypothetical protein ACXADS_12640 [Candidatus Thorarchaeota archaeon]